METTPFFVIYPLVWLFVALICCAFVCGFFFKRAGIALYALGAVGFIALAIFALLHQGSYLDVALLALICLIPLCVMPLLHRRQKEGEHDV